MIKMIKLIASAPEILAAFSMLKCNCPVETAEISGSSFKVALDELKAHGSEVANCDGDPNFLQLTTHESQVV